MFVAAGRPVESVNFDVKERIMATGESGFDDVTYDLISVQYHAL
jgi:hypothetical protein